MREDHRAQHRSPGSGMGRAVVEVPPFIAEAARTSLQGTEMETEWKGVLSETAGCEPNLALERVRLDCKRIFILVL